MPHGAAKLFTPLLAASSAGERTLTLNDLRRGEALTACARARPPAPEAAFPRQQPSSLLGKMRCWHPIPAN